MMVSVKAKFRVMKVADIWNGECTVVDFLPVMAKSKHSNDPEDSEENAMFWEATPSGEAQLTFKGLGASPFTIGKCVRIDMTLLTEEEAKEERSWSLESVKESHNMSVDFNLRWDTEPIRRGSLCLDIANKKAWPWFQNKALTRWRIAFSAVD